MLGFDVESPICFVPEKPGIAVRVLRFFKVSAKRILKLCLAALGVKKYREKIKGSFHKVLKHQNEKSRWALYKEFYDDLIGKKIYTTYKKMLNSDQKRWDEYSYVVAGSDQIWNSKVWCTTEQALEYYYLSFVPREKRVNYAPSFGIMNLDTSHCPAHIRGLEGFKKLSCREKRGCEIIHELTGRNAQLVLDPTLLMTAEQWSKIARQPLYDVPEHYVLLYFFGDAKKYSGMFRKIAGDTKIIDVLNPESSFYELTGPREFIWLIEHADIVLTNSFHGTAFSVNFGKNFLSIVEDNQEWLDAWFSRIQSLLSSLNLMDRVVYGLSNEIPEMLMNYAEAHEKLNIMRENSMEYLRECLNVKR